MGIACSPYRSLTSPVLAGCSLPSVSSKTSRFSVPRSLNLSEWFLVTAAVQCRSLPSKWRMWYRHGFLRRRSSNWPNDGGGRKSTTEESFFFLTRCTCGRELEQFGTSASSGRAGTRSVWMHWLGSCSDRSVGSGSRNPCWSVFLRGSPPLAVMKKPAARPAKPRQSHPNTPQSHPKAKNPLARP